MELPNNVSPDLRAYCGTFVDEDQLLSGLEGEPNKLVELVQTALQDDNWRASHLDLMDKFSVMIRSGVNRGTIGSSEAQDLIGRIDKLCLNVLQCDKCELLTELPTLPIHNEPKIKMLDVFNITQLASFDFKIDFDEEIKKEKAIRQIIINAHVLGLKGIHHIDRQPLNLEGAKPVELNDHMQKVFADFANENPLMKEKLSPENIEDIKQAFANASLKGMSQSDGVLDALKSGKSALILGGTVGHLINLVFCNDKLIICNRGEGVKPAAGGKCQAGVVYDCKADTLKEQTVRKLLTEFPNIQEFAAAIDSSFGKVKLDDLGFTKKEQKVGNCTWASAKTALYALLYSKCDSKTADEIYKAFTVFARKQAIEELRNDPKVPPDLLQKAEQKYQKKIKT